MPDTTTIAESNSSKAQHLLAVTDLLGNRHWTVMLFSPARAEFVTYCRGTWTAPGDGHGEFVPDDRTFSARAFDGSGEVRWHTGLPPVTVSAPGGNDDAGCWIDGQRLLWGQSTGRTIEARCACGATSTWTRLSDPRIGGFLVPADIPLGRAAALRVREVVGTDGHGNRSVTDEVIRGLVEFSAEGGGDRG